MLQPLRTSELPPRRVRRPAVVHSAAIWGNAKRLVKRQQMQWTKKGAHLLVQARTRVLNEEWEDCFRQQYPGFRPMSAEPMPMAA